MPTLTARYPADPVEVGGLLLVGGGQSAVESQSLARPADCPLLTAHSVLVGTTELESVTSCMSSKRSNQLSYAPIRVSSVRLNGIVETMRAPEFISEGRLRLGALECGIEIAECGVTRKWIGEPRASATGDFRKRGVKVDRRLAYTPQIAPSQLSSRIRGLRVDVTPVLAVVFVEGPPLKRACRGGAFMV